VAAAIYTVKWGNPMASATGAAKSLPGMQSCWHASALTATRLLPCPECTCDILLRDKDGPDSRRSPRLAGRPAVSGGQPFLPPSLPLFNKRYPSDTMSLGDTCSVACRGGARLHPCRGKCCTLCRRRACARYVLCVCCASSLAPLASRVQGQVGK
jgi:hypothetical protein